MNDVARHAGVALSTASAALNRKSGKYAVSPEKLAAVMHAVRELNFEANPHAKRLVTGSDADTIGIYVIDIDAGVGMQTLRELQFNLVKAGYNVPIYSSGGSDLGDCASRAKLMASLRLQRPRAIISSSNEEEILKELRRHIDDGGLVVTYRRKSSLECDQVHFDEEANTYEAAAHLLRLGHRQVGFYKDGNGPIRESPRFTGFMRALKEYGGSTRDEWLVTSGNFYSKTIQEGGGELLAKVFLNWTERPTAMCIVNDASAAAFVSEIQRAGVRVPQDLSVVGHDDTPIARVVTPRLTTVRHPVQEIANETARLLLTRLSGEYVGPPRLSVVEGHLIERESAAAPSESK